jgi:hypothetical protein
LFGTLKEKHLITTEKSMANEVKEFQDGEVVYQRAINDIIVHMVTLYQLMNEEGDVTIIS